MALTHYQAIILRGISLCGQIAKTMTYRYFKFLVGKESNNFEAIFEGIIENHSNSYIRMMI